jgi:tRNA(fMet)-specific endonuclease VapC
MSVAAGYLLDTNILIQLLRGNALGRYIDRTYDLRSTLSHCVISVVTVGEMGSLVRKLKWGTRRVDALTILLNELPWMDINDSAALEAYAEIDHFSDQNGTSMGKNDVWIAATAKATGMTLLTTDKDFDHLHGKFLQRIWIDPATGKSND